MCVYVIIVNWNGRSLLHDCLHSLKKQAYKNFRVVVVDNGSTDDSVGYVKRHFKDVKLITLSKNTGFSVANNIGIKWALKDGADAIALLNNDCEVHEDWLANQVEILKKNSDVGACASLLLYQDDRHKINGLGLCLTHLGFASDDYCGHLYRDNCEPGETVGFTGGACLIRALVFREIGFFDPFYFLYYEDIDFSLRIWQHGYKIVTVPSAIAYHKWAATSRKYPFKVRYLVTRNHIYFLCKFFPVNKIFQIIAVSVSRYAGYCWMFVRRRQFRLIFAVILGFIRGLIQVPFVLAKKDYSLTLLDVEDKIIQDRQLTVSMFLKFFKRGRG